MNSARTDGHRVREAELLRKLNLGARWTVGVGSALILAAQLGMTWGHAGPYDYSSADYFTQEMWIVYVLGLGPVIAIFGAATKTQFSLLLEIAAGAPAAALIYALVFVQPTNLAGLEISEGSGFWLAMVVSIPTALAGMALNDLVDLPQPRI